MALTYRAPTHRPLDDQTGGDHRGGWPVKDAADAAEDRVRVHIVGQPHPDMIAGRLDLGAHRLGHHGCFHGGAGPRQHRRWPPPPPPRPPAHRPPEPVHRLGRKSRTYTSTWFRALSISKLPQMRRETSRKKLQFSSRCHGGAPFDGTLLARFRARNGENCRGV